MGIFQCTSSNAVLYNGSTNILLELWTNSFGKRLGHVEFLTLHVDIDRTLVILTLLKALPSFDKLTGFFQLVGGRFQHLFE